jgi:uncharacterized membrane protein YhaH (DUF805 family)
MNFQSSLKTCFNKYATVKGRASRSEFWYFYLFFYATIILILLVTSRLLNTSFDTPITLVSIFILVMLCPVITVTARRLHDVGRSGWWQLISGLPFVGIIGLIFLLIWWCTEGEKKKNKYGPPLKLKR